MRKSVKMFLLGAGVSAVVNSLFVLAEYKAVSPNGSDDWLWSLMILIVPLLIALGVFVCSIVFLVPGRTRRVAAVVLGASATYLVVAVACMWIGGYVRMRAFGELADRSDSFVAAIKDFERDRGRPPQTLAELVPAYVPAIPSTGMGAYPDYEYVAGTEAESRFHGNPWVLWVDTPSGGINWDMFIYYPRQNYPSNAHGGWLERVKQWAYVHE